MPLPGRAAALVAVVTLLIVAAPASAFPGAKGRVEVVYPEAARPFAIAVGSLGIEGPAAGTLLGAGLEEAQFREVPRLIAAEVRAGGVPEETTVVNATLILHSGSIAWNVPTGAGTVGVAGRGRSAIALLPPPAAPGNGSSMVPGVIVAGPGLAVDVAHDALRSDLLPMGATLSLLGPDGDPVPGWDHRAVNGGVTTAGANASEPGRVAFRFEGRFGAALPLRLLAVDPAGSADAPFTLAVDGPSAGDLDDVVALLDEIGPLLGSERTTVPAGMDLFRLTDGGLVIAPRLAGSGAPPGPPTSATARGAPVEADPFLYAKSGSVQAEWNGSAWSVSGEAAFVLTGEGFAADGPPFLGPFPVAGVVLWLLAGAAILARLVAPPPAGVPDRRAAVAGLPVHVAVLLLVLLAWDAAFASTFGTSVVRLVAGGTVGGLYFLVVAAAEFVPWGLASLYFGLPVRIAARAGLRYAGKGDSLKGFARALGAVALLIVGLPYALALANTVLREAIGRVAGLP